VKLALLHREHLSQTVTLAVSIFQLCSECVLTTTEENDNQCELHVFVVFTVNCNSWISKFGQRVRRTIATKIYSVT
jgi:hypothetical protein